MRMKTTSLELQLHSNLYKDMKLKSYVVASLLYDHRSKSEKLIANVDKRRYVKLQFRDVNVNDSATLCLQVFISRNSLLLDVLIGTLNVRVSDLILLVTPQCSGTYEFATLWSRKTNSNVIEFSYTWSVDVLDTASIAPSPIE
ncbi:hypothetical protein RND81_13G087200 [Saponaria officinalis]|uniref:Uncharacterized protein n=1 Tax=Saponaria officinalis TaxID=3572 RepID=A0AAW1GZ35_SAPOF